MPALLPFALPPFARASFRLFGRLDAPVRRPIAWLLGLSIPLVASSIAIGNEGPDFTRDVRPILSNHCFNCHGPDTATREGGLRLDRPESAFAPADSGRIAIVPRDAAASELMRRIMADDDSKMPPHEFGKPLDDAQRGILRAWIEAGAPYEAHWAFAPPERSALPDVSPRSAAWSRSAIDRHVARRLEATGLAPQDDAPRELWLRRVTLDLTGAPPTIDDRRRFLDDRSPDADARLVDRLLASAGHAERMTNLWLDVARFADTNGYNNDETRSMWPWRDWVIDAYRTDLPYDRFLTEQIAGDLLPDASTSQRVATGFVRNHVLTTEGGIIEEEYQAEYVADRVHTVSTVFLGLSLQCARCHDHKYDPLSQRDFYRFAAFFGNVPDRIVGYSQGKMAEPLLEVPTEEQRRSLDRIASRAAEVTQALSAREADVESIDREVDAWSAGLAAEALAALGPIDELARFDLDAPLTGNDGRERFADRRNGERFATVLGSIGSVERPLATGQVDRALSLDGNGWLETPGLAGFAADDSFTIASWIRHDRDDSMAIASRIDDAADFRGWDLVVEQGHLAFHFVERWPDRAFKVVADPKLEAGRWHHVAVTYAGSGRSDSVRLAIDGRIVSTKATTDNAIGGSPIADQPLRIGRRSASLPFYGAIDDLRLFAAPLDSEELSALARGEEPRGLAELLAIPVEARDEATRDLLRRRWLADVDPASLSLRQELVALEAERTAIEQQIPRTMVMAELDPPRPTHLLIRGQYDQLGEAVEPGLPEALVPGIASSPTEQTDRLSRLDLARWMTSDDHPLTSRVAANRLWEMLFGTGLVETSEDFGIQGSAPSHPELLDHLAFELIDGDWSQRRLLRRIVLTSTYRQSSYASHEGLERDPNGRLLSRGPRHRLNAETVRDNALAIAGLLETRSGGASVMPYQPEGLWEDVSVERREKYVVGNGADLYRRSMYTFWKRTCPPPTMASFDAPDRETCVVRRARTNTPLQALVLLNDPTYVEAARVLAESLLSESRDDRARLELAYLRAVCRQPSDAEARVLLDLLGEARARFAADPSAADKLTSIGRSPRPATLDPVELAAWSVVTDVILNLDETVSKP